MPRQFEGKYFYFYDQYPSREEAYTIAKQLRKQGRLVRVIKASAFLFTGDFDVYTTASPSIAHTEEVERCGVK